MHLLMMLLLLICIMALIASAPVVSAFDVWIGTAPFCKANPSNCHKFDLHYLRSDPVGVGYGCNSGAKVLCQPKPLDANLLETPANSLVVVAYNVFERPFSVSHDGQSERTCHIPRTLLAKFPDVDVIIFTELLLGGCMLSTQANRYVSVRDLMGNYGFQYSTGTVGESSRAFYSVNGGAVIVSRWPILDSSQIVFTNYAGADRLAEKGVVYAKVLKKGSYYHVFGTQMQRDEANYKTRVKQAEEVSNFVAELDLSPDEPVIIGGDFNCDRLGKPEHTSEVLQAMYARMPTVVGDATATYDYSNNEMVLPDHTTKQWLDYVVYSSLHRRPSTATMEVVQLKADKSVEFCSSAPMQPFYVSAEAATCASVKVTKDLSDHFPVVARFSFNQ